MAKMRHTEPGDELAGIGFGGLRGRMTPYSKHARAERIREMAAFVGGLVLRSGNGSSDVFLSAFSGFVTTRRCRAYFFSAG